MVSPETVAFVGVGAAAVLTVALLAVERPPVNGLTVVATAPWMVVAGIFHALSATGAYPDGLSPLFQLPMGFVVTFVVAGLVWVPLLQLATLRDFTAGSGRYLAAAGTGAAIVLLTTLLLREGLDGRGMLWLSATPLLAALLGGIAYFTWGFVDATTLARARWVGLLIVLSFATLGTTVAVGVDIYGVGGGTLSQSLVGVSSTFPTATVSVAWPLVALAVVLGNVVAAGVARTVDTESSGGYLFAVAVIAATLGPAVGHLLVTVLR